jgi:hypothetical protein
MKHIRIVQDGKIYDTRKMEEVVMNIQGDFCVYHILKSPKNERYVLFTQSIVGTYLVSEMDKSTAQEWCECHRIPVETQMEQFGLKEWDEETKAERKPENSFDEHMKQIEAHINASRKFMDWTEDDCEEIGTGWSENTWKRATEYVLEIINKIWITDRVFMDIPDIEPGRDGSIDIHWDYPDYELLINVKASESEKATFYGDN